MTNEELAQVTILRVQFEGFCQQLRDTLKLYYAPGELVNTCVDGNIQECLDYLRVATKYTLFNINAYRLELEYVKKQLKIAES